MNNTETDRELRDLLKKINLESPGPDFTGRVMAGIAAREKAGTTFKPAPLLGKSFWILSSLFLVLMAVFMAIRGISLPDIVNRGIGFQGIALPELTPLVQVITRITGCFSMVPESAALTMLAATLLILGDLLFSTKGKTIGMKG